MTEKQEKTDGQDNGKITSSLSDRGDLIFYIPNGLRMSEETGKLVIESEHVTEFIAVVNNAKADHIARLKRQLALLEGTGSTVAPVKASEETIVQPPSKESLPKKPYKFGECYTCDTGLRSGEGQPCVICRRTSHKKCLEAHVCGPCLDSADAD